MKEFVFNNWYYILYISITAISLVFTIVTYHKSRKNAKTEREKEKAKEQAIDDIKKSINGFIIDAEKLKHYTGQEKKEYVITRALQIANDALTQKEIDEYIEMQVYLTDNVNKHAEKGG